MYLGCNSKGEEKSLLTERTKTFHLKISVFFEMLTLITKFMWQISEALFIKGSTYSSIIVPLLLYNDSPILAFYRYLLVHLYIYIYTFLYFYSSVHGESPWSILTFTVVYLHWTIIVASWYCWLWCCVAAFGQFSIVTEAFIFISDILLHFIESYLPSVSPNLLMKFISMSLLYFYYYFGLVSILRTLILNY